MALSLSTVRRWYGLGGYEEIRKPGEERAEMRKCVICKRRVVPVSDSKRGSCGTTFVQWCPACGRRWSYFVGQYEGKVKVDSDWV